MADLGGLGNREGSPLSYEYTPPSQLPHLAPWLAIGLLLLLKANRLPGAWWILAPLAVVQLTTAALDPLARQIDSAVMPFFLEMAAALAFGLAAVWLLARYLAQPPRIVTLVLVATVLVTATGLAFVMPTLEAGHPGFFLFLALGALIVAVAMTWLGTVYRCRPRLLSLSAYLLVALALAWLLAGGVLVLLIRMASGNGPPLGEFLAVILATAGATFLVLLPFLVLSMKNALYRERLERMLQPATAPRTLPPSRSTQA